MNKGSDLVESLKKHGWGFITLYLRAVNKAIPKKQKGQMAQWLAEEVSK